MAEARGTVVVIEDGADQARLIAVVLEAEAFRPLVFETAEEGVAAALNGNPVAVILDWGLPDRPGVEVCREIRAANPEVPIIFLSGRQDEATMARALDAGADDFVIKPFRRTEFIARLEAHVRRAQRAQAARRAPAAPPSAEAPTAMRMGDVEIDLAARDVRIDGRSAGLGPYEYKLVEVLVAQPGKALTREHLLSAVYGYQGDISADRVDYLARRVRSKLGDGPRRGGQLVTVPGYGWRWERRPREDST
jgi:DNA-binding response OmpR family regulator